MERFQARERRRMIPIWKREVAVRFAGEVFRERKRVNRESEGRRGRGGSERWLTVVGQRLAMEGVVRR